jgi:PAS domain-containing protein
MSETELPSFDVMGEQEESAAPPPVMATETIDLSNLFSGDVSSSGTFDLRAISSSTFGRLLDALPIPALLVDRYYQVGFANQACEKISSGYKKILGIPFADLVPLPSDARRAQALSEKIQALIGKAFETRKPRVAEAILEIENKRIWARLHLRSVKIGLERYVLLIIEDLTIEKRQLVLSQRHDESHRQARCVLGKRIYQLTAEISALKQELGIETEARVQSQESLRQQEQQLDALWKKAPFGLAFVGPGGFVQRVNRKFNDMFGYDVIELANNRDWIDASGDSGLARAFSSISDWTEALGLSTDQPSATRMLTVRRKDGATNRVQLTAVKTMDEELLLVFYATDF